MTHCTALHPQAVRCAPQQQVEPGLSPDPGGRAGPGQGVRPGPGQGVPGPGEDVHHDPGEGVHCGPGEGAQQSEWGHNASGEREWGQNAQGEGEWGHGVPGSAPPCQPVCMLRSSSWFGEIKLLLQAMKDHMYKCIPFYII